MTSTQDDGSTIATKETETTKPRRGKVCLSRLAKRRAKGIITDVDFNTRGQPVGKNATEMQSFIGLITREHVKVNIKDWREVPQDVKELIWESVKASYKVPEEWKSRCLISAGIKWRTWKTRLYNKFIVPNLDDHAKLFEPPPDSGIRPLDWNQFVMSRMSDDFKKLSDLQRERVRKHEYPHTMSRKGYPNLIEEIKHEERVCDPFSLRGVAWKRARMSKDGKVNNAKAKEAIDKMDQILQEKEEGKLISHEGEDLLSIALKKPDRPGRVRGMGAGVTYAAYFKTVGGSSEGLPEKSVQELENARKKIDEQGKVICDLADRLGKLESKMGEREKFSEGLGSCSVKPPEHIEQFKEPIEEGNEAVEQGNEAVEQGNKAVEQGNEPIEQGNEVVDLDDSLISPGKPVALLLGSSKKIVAYGTTIVVGDKLHGAPMPKECFRVSVDEVVDGDALLPFRVSDEILTVGSALATHVAWPTNLVVERVIEVKEPTPSKKKKVSKKLFLENKVQNIASLPPSLRALHFVMDNSFKDGKGIRVSMDIEVFGTDVRVWLLEQDIIPVCNLEPITGNCILVYIWHLYQIMEEDNRKNKFMFVNPFGISNSKGLTCEDRGRALAGRLLTARSDQLVLAPCNTGAHWILTIIEPHNENIYLLDPLNQRTRDRDWGKVVEIAMNIFKSKQGDKTNIRCKPAPISIQCHKQPDAKQCGFYVMGYMKQIVKGFANDGSMSLASLFQKKSYTQEQIDEIRAEWANCVIRELG